MSKLLNTREACEILRISVNTLIRMREAGKINPVCFTPGKFFYREEDVRKLISGE